MAGTTLTQSLRYGHVTDVITHAMQRDLADDIAVQLDAADALRTTAMKRAVARVSRGTSLALPNLTMTTVTFTSETTDTHAMVDIATQPTRITVSSAAGAGTYFVDAQIQFVYGGWTRADVAIFKNGVFYCQRTWRSPQDLDVLRIGAFVNLGTVGDYLTMGVYHEGGGTTGDFFQMRAWKNST